MSTSPQRQQEAEQATQAYQLALSYIGVRTTAQALALWNHVPPGARPAIVQAWLRAAVKLIKGRRKQSRDLAMAYYRLARALQTGETIADPIRDEKTVTLGELRQEFASLAGTTPVQLADDSDEILVKEIDRLRELEDHNEQLAEQEIRIDLSALGPAAQEKLLKGVSEDLPAGEVDKLRKEAHSATAARQAAAAARIAMNGGRTESWLLQENDSGAIGYVRVSTTGTPCGWCAMLISRGPVYKSKQSAEYSDGDKYHDNCHCIAVPVFSREWFNKSPMFALNRQYAKEWPLVTRGLGGKDAVSAWRRYIRQQQAAARREAA